MPGPLAGIKVFDLSFVAAGPWTTMLLGALGAEVIKIEAPAGDLIRQVPPSQKGMGVVYIHGNLNKRGIILDLKQDRNKEIAFEMIESSDVFIQNMKPGVVDRLGFGYDVVSKLNPGIVYLSNCAYGKAGPMCQDGGVDPTIQAFGGWCGITGQPGGPPEMYRYYMHMDLTTCGYITAAVLQGLLARERTGQGQKIELTMVAASLALQTSRLAEYFAGANPQPMGSACMTTVPHQAFLCEDKRYIAVGVVAEDQWPRFCAALGLADLAEDPRFAANPQRVHNRAELIPILAQVFITKPVAWWVLKLSEQRVPNGRFLDFEALRYHPTIVENEYIVQVDTGHWGPLCAGGLPWKFSKTPAQMRRGPAPGEHTQEVLQEVASGAWKSAFPEARLPAPAERRELAGALAGIKVIDITQGICGPYCSMQLGDAGAEILKVEPLDGDSARRMGPPFIGDESALYLSLNRNKKSVAVDIRSETGRQLILRLADSADVFIEDLGPGETDALGLGYKDLTAINPQIVYASITAFGEKGPLRDLPGAELPIQAMSDCSGSLGAIGEPPVRLGADVANMNTAVHAVQAILAALFHRQRTGEGQRVVASMLGSSLHIRGALWAALGDPDEWWGFHLDSHVKPPEYGYKTKDGYVYFNLRRGTQEDFDNLLIHLGMADCLGDPRFNNGGREAAGVGRYAHQVKHLWEEALKEKTTQEVIDLMKSVKAEAVPVSTYDLLFAHPQTPFLDMVEEIEHPTVGKFKVTGIPGKFSATPGAIVSPPPALGQHTDEILRSCGYHGEEIAQLRKQKVLR